MRVNLLPPQLRRRRGVNWSRVGTTALLTVAMVAPTGYLGLAQLRMFTLRGRVAAANAEYQSYVPALRQKEELDKLAQELAAKKQFIAQLRGQGVQWNAILREIQRLVPSTVVLTSLATAPPDKVVIAGNATNLQSVAQFIVSLSQGRTVAGADPEATSLSRDDKTGRYSFQLTVKVRPGAGP